jgi:hypothetical protein
MPNDKTVSKRIESTKEYIDALLDKHSKLCVVRVDLSYKKPHSDSITLDDANSNFNRMMNNRRSKPSVFKDQVGYICKKEYTEDKGVHFHAVIFYDGQKVQKGKYKATQIGEYWNEQITDNKGSYFNCNRKQYKYPATGILEHTDDKKRENLDRTVAYLCKDDHQDIAPVKSNKKDRAFVRGTMPKSKGNIGRPRK